MNTYFFDIEADGLIEDATRIWCGVFKCANTKVVHKFTPENIKDMIAFMKRADVLIGHNIIGYDLPLIKRLTGFSYNGEKVDTLLISRLLNTKRVLPTICTNRSAGPHSLEAWGWRVGRGKPSHEDWLNFSPEMLHRCTEDVEITELVYRELQEEAKKQPGSYKNAYKLTAKLFEYLRKQEDYGWMVDKDHMLFCIKQLTRWIGWIDKALSQRLPLTLEIDELKSEGVYGWVKKPFLKNGKPSLSHSNWLLSAGISEEDSPVAGPFSRIHFRKIDLDSTNETKEYLLKNGWEPLEWNTDSSGVKTSPKLSKEDTFDGVDGKLGKIIVKRVQCKQRRGIIEGMLELIRTDGRISSVINSLAATGRGTHRNIVNIPGARSFYGRQMRKIFTSGKGKVLVGTDSTACQLRMLAARMKNEEYIEAVCTGTEEQGNDPHTLTQKIGGLESRSVAKNTIYCLLFGGGDEKLGKTAKQPGRGKEVREKLFKGFTGFGEMVEKLNSEWKKTATKKFDPKRRTCYTADGYIIGLDGRPLRVPSEHQILVYLLQSDEAIMMSMAYVKLNMELEKRFTYGEDYGVVCFYHDEYTVECKESIAEEVKVISEKAIEWAGRYYKIACPHKGSGKIGKNWYDIH